MRQRVAPSDSFLVTLDPAAETLAHPQRANQHLPLSSHGRVAETTVRRPSIRRSRERAASGSRERADPVGLRDDVAVSSHDPDGESKRSTNASWKACASGTSQSPSQTHRRPQRKQMVYS